MQFESLPEKRAVPAFVKKAPAQSIVLELMKSGAAEREASGQKLEREQKRADHLAVALALQIYRKRASDDAFVRALTALLADMQVQVFTYAGEDLTTELEAGADIVEWLPAEENESACVAEAIEPEIRWQGRILHRAKLSCRKALEREPEPTQEQAGAGLQEPVAQTGQEAPQKVGDVSSETVSGEPCEDRPTETPKKPNLLNRVKAIWNRLTSRRNAPEAPARAEESASDQTEQTSASDETDQTSASEDIEQTSASDEIDQTSASDETDQKSASDETDQKSASDDIDQKSASDEIDQKSASDDIDQKSASDEINQTSASDQIEQISDQEGSKSI